MARERGHRSPIEVQSPCATTGKGVGSLGEGGWADNLAAAGSSLRTAAKPSRNLTFLPQILPDPHVD